MKNASRSFFAAGAIGLSLALSGCATNGADSDINACKKLAALNAQGTDAIAAKDWSGVQDTLDAYKRLGEGTPTALGRSIVKAYVSIHDSIQNNTVPNPADISGPGSPTDLCGKLGVHVVQG